MQLYNDNIYYLIKLKNNFIELNPLICKTTVNKVFCGTLVNNADGKAFFELNGSKALVVVPWSGIEWMAPSQVLWEKRRKEKIHDKELWRR